LIAASSDTAAVADVGSWLNQRENGTKGNSSDYYQNSIFKSGTSGNRKTTVFIFAKNNEIAKT